MSKPTLAEQTQATLNEFMSNIPEQDQEVVAAAFQRLMDSQTADSAINVGDYVPDFKLPNASGDIISFNDLLKDGPVVINFYRGGWCPFCNLEFKALHDHLAEIEGHGARLIGIAPETPETTQDTIENHGLRFEVLCDQGNQLADRFGLLMVVDEAMRPLYQKWGIDLPAANGDDSFALPVPATYVIDAEGIVRGAYVDKNYTQRMEPSEIIKILSDL